MKEMIELCDIKEALLWLYNATSLLVDAIERDKISEVRHHYLQILDRRNYETWNFEDQVVEHIDMRMMRFFSWGQNGEDET